MESTKVKLSGIMDTEMFGDDRRQYYFDIKKARNNKHYLRITRRDQAEDESFNRTQIILFEDDLGFFAEAISMLLGRFSQGQTSFTVV
ncbi:MAG: hypothetical protein JWQ66_4461 [Mucilaginibacter sp.]|nr:hypothetical protein [Mucilaginibacter sp.]